MDGLLRVYAKTNVLLAINLVRLALIIATIHWAIASWGLVGAILVTVLALALGKAIGLVTVASIWRVNLGRLLPWRALISVIVIAASAAVPAVAVAYGLQAPPFVRLLAVGTVYAATYAALVMAFGLLSRHERAAVSQSLGRLQFILPVRYQHKTS
jgi:hypothetical protein